MVALSFTTFDNINDAAWSIDSLRRELGWAKVDILMEKEIDNMEQEFEVYYASNNEWRWRLRATNGKIIADSGEGYNEMSDCLHGVQLIKDGACFASVRVMKAGETNTQR